jgi:hypothetical protein
MRVRCSWRGACALLPLLLLASLSSCSPGGPAADATVTSLPRATQSPVVSSETPPSSEPVPESATSCNQVPELAGGLTTQMYNLNFPWEGLAVATITTPTTTAMQVASYVACLPFSPASGTPTPPGPNIEKVITVLGFSERGWVLSKDFPIDGENLTACSAVQRCFRADLQTYVLVEQARSNHNGLVVFDLLMALPQPLVPCDPVLFPYVTYPDSVTPYWAATIPLPPGTRTSSGFGTSEGITQYFCSAGTAKQVSDYMQAHLPEKGWEKIIVNDMQFWTIQTHGAPRLYMRLSSITDPRKWSELEYFQGFTP